MTKIINEMNRTVVGLALFLLVGVFGFLWWQMMYKPAMSERSSAELSATSAQQALDEARGRLTAAQQEIDAAKRQNGGKFDESIGRLQLSSLAITPDADIDDAIVLLARFADRAGISTKFELESGGQANVTNEVVGGAEPVTIKLKAAGTWSELKQFIKQVESSVDAKRGKLHVRGRLFNVAVVEARPPEKALVNNGQPDPMNPGGSSDYADLQIGPKDYVYDLTIRMYSSTFSQAATTAPGTGDAAAGATGTTGTPGATGTGAPGTGTTTTPGATGTTPGTSTPTIPSTTPTTQPTGTSATGGATPTGTMPTPSTSVPTGSSTVPGGTGTTTPTGATG